MVVAVGKVIISSINLTSLRGWSAHLGGLVVMMINEFVFTVCLYFYVLLI